MTIIAILTTLVIVLSSSLPAAAQSKKEGQGQGLGNVLDTLSGILGGSQRVHGNIVLTKESTIVLRGDDGRTYAVDASSIDPRLRGILQPGEAVTVVVKTGQNQTPVASDIQLDRVKSGAIPQRKSFHQVLGTVELVTGSQVLFKTRDGLELPVDVSTIKGLPALTPKQPATLIYEPGHQHQIEAVWIEPGHLQPTAGAPSGTASPSASPAASPATDSGGVERIHGLIDAVSLAGLTLQSDDGRKLAIDTTKIDSRLVQALRPGDLITVVGRLSDKPGLFVADSLHPDSLR